MIKHNKYLFFLYIILTLFISLFILEDRRVVSSSMMQGNKKDEEYDNKLEELIALIIEGTYERFPGYEDILKSYFSINLEANRSLYKKLDKNCLILVNEANNIYSDLDTTFLARKYKTGNPEKEFKERMIFFDKVYRELESFDLNLYIYCISDLWTSDAVHEFVTDVYDPHKYFRELQWYLFPRYQMDYLKIADMDAYRKYFFKSDHHWTIEGAYEAYKDIIKLMDADESKLIEPDFFKVTGVKFKGSNARLSAITKLSDDLYDIYNEYTDADYKIYANSYRTTLDVFSKKYDYLDGEIPDDEFYNHYSSYFHTDIAEIIYEFYKERKNDRNLLILSDSFDNNMDNLIASHFNTTYIVDTRYYENAFFKKFNISEYIEENDITDVLFLMSSNSIYFKSADIKIE